MPIIQEHPSQPIVGNQPTANPLRQLQQFGQSPWLDFIRRQFIASGDLKRLVDEDGLCGVTSNPSIFEKALSGSTDYDAALAAVSHHDRDAMALYESFALDDIRQAADVLRPVYERSQRRDGYVSLEVSPYLAHDTAGSLAEARRLWKAVGRDNLMVKVPGTREGIPAFRQLISEGININVTLLFSRETYAQVVEAYLAGLEALASGGGDVSRIASVASFFVSRIDTAIDALLDAKVNATTSENERTAPTRLLGRAAIANAKLAYQTFKAIFQGKRWDSLASRGACVQRLLWASTSTKNPHLRDVLYVEELIGADTVNTMPPATMDAFRDHGRPRSSLEEDLGEASRVMDGLAQIGISMEAVTERLVADGVRLFSESFDALLAAVEKKRK